jgi:Amt family ammonium transporter
VAQLIGVATLLGFVFTVSYVANLAIHFIVGQRVSASDELEGLDIPEMGALCYPEFVLKPDTSHSGAAASVNAGLQVARETA